MPAIQSLLFYFGFLLQLCGPGVSKTQSSHEYNVEDNHPFYVSVTELHENTKEKILEVTCRIFTDDFEKELRNKFNTHVDLLNDADKTNMGKLINSYIREHLKISVDGKLCTLEYIGFEKDEEAVDCYFQVSDVVIQKSVSVTNNILYDYKREEINIVHVTAKGIRKSTQLVNPEEKASFEF